MDDATSGAIGAGLVALLWALVDLVRRKRRALSEHPPRRYSYPPRRRRRDDDTPSQRGTSACAWCLGTGYVEKRPCPECGATGRVPR